MRNLRLLLAAALFMSAASVVSAQDTPAGGTPQEPTPAAPAGREPEAPGPRPYEQVITKDARSDVGVFTVHRLRDRLLYEIPTDRLGREFLWVSQIAKTTLGAGYGGQAAGNHVVRWERRDNRILLRSVSYELVADEQTPIARAVQAANFDPILMVFNIATVGKNEAPVIDVTRLFTTDVPEFSGRTRVRARTFEAQRSFVERAVSFPENIEVEAIHTYNNPPEQPGAGQGAPPAPRWTRGAAPAPGHRQRGDALQHGVAP